MTTCRKRDCNREPSRIVVIDQSQVELCAEHEAELRLWLLADKLRISPLIAGHAREFVAAELKFIYAVGKLPEGPIKIGCTSDPIQRLYDLRSSSPNVVEILAAAPGNFTTERLAHKVLHPYLVQGREWFRPTPEVLNVISGLAMISFFALTNPHDELIEQMESWFSKLL